MTGYIDSKYARGPARWERAALNAMRKPNSTGARLYHKRVTLAYEITEAARVSAPEVADTPYAFVETHRNWVWDPDAGCHVVSDPKDVRAHTTCSLFCAVMQMQLDYRVKDVEGVTAIINKTSPACTGMWPRWVEPLNKSTLTRKVRCQVCATEVKPA